MTVRHLNRTEFAELIGVKRTTIWRYKLPPADVVVGPDMPGWLPETVEEWQKRRPGTGHWRDNPNWELPPAVDNSKPVRHLSRTEFAELIGAKRSSFWSIDTPEPDVMVGPNRAGWLPQTVEEWQAQRGEFVWSWRKSWSK